MKADIHPTYFPQAKIKCACGNVIGVGSTKENIEVEICSNCHPFFTGKGRLIDTSGRVERFKARESKKQVPRNLPNSLHSSKQAGKKQKARSTGKSKTGKDKQNS